MREFSCVQIIKDKIEAKTLNVLERLSKLETSRGTIFNWLVLRVADTWWLNVLGIHKFLPSELCVGEELAQIIGHAAESNWGVVMLECDNADIVYAESLPPGASPYGPQALQGSTTDRPRRTLVEKLRVLGVKAIANRGLLAFSNGDELDLAKVCQVCGNNTFTAVREVHEKHEVLVDVNGDVLETESMGIIGNKITCRRCAVCNEPVEL